MLPSGAEGFDTNMTHTHLELFPSLVRVHIDLSIVACYTNLVVTGPGVSINSYWLEQCGIVRSFPALGEVVAKMLASDHIVGYLEVSEKLWTVWTEEDSWPIGTAFYWN